MILQEFATFFIYCSLAGMEKCPYALGDTPGDIFLRFEKTLAKLDYARATREGWANATIIATVVTTLKGAISKAQYNPRQLMPNVATGMLALEVALDNLTLDTLTKLAEDFAGEEGEAPAEADSMNDWFAGNTCSDQNNIMRNVTVKEIWPLVSTLQHQSYIGGDTMLGNWATCLGWSIYPKEAYQGMSRNLFGVENYG